jgi:hypothetical protein
MNVPQLRSRTTPKTSSCLEKRVDKKARKSMLINAQPPRSETPSEETETVIKKS